MIKTKEYLQESLNHSLIYEVLPYSRYKFVKKTISTVDPITSRTKHGSKDNPLV